MSPILESVATAVGGIAAGYALAAAHLWRTTRALRAARTAATRDPLTGLPNRRALYTRLDTHLRHGRPVAVALVDLDDFKAINDRFGHAAGDEVLRAVADRLAALPAPADMVARLGGDEFVLVIADSDHAMAAAKAAWQAITAPVRLDGHLLDTAASIGVASHRLGLDTRQLLHHADVAMYEAKTLRAGVRAYIPGTADTPIRPRPARRRRDRHP